MRKFSAHETEWLLELDGIELASFWQRAFAFLLDWMVVSFLLSFVAFVLAAVAFTYMHGQGRSLQDMAHMFSASLRDDKLDVGIQGASKANVYRIDENSVAGEVIKIFFELLVPVLYFGILLWRGKGRTPGKCIMRIRVVSIVHRHLSFWHSVERALGYGAAALEGGFGFIQFFIHPYRRCAQDRLAETMVVTERGYQAMQTKHDHALLPDSEQNEGALE